MGILALRSLTLLQGAKHSKVELLYHYIISSSFQDRVDFLCHVLQSLGNSAYLTNMFKGRLLAGFCNVDTYSRWFPYLENWSSWTVVSGILVSPVVN